VDAESAFISVFLPNSTNVNLASAVYREIFENISRPKYSKIGLILK